jgi:hypothetical protein
MQLEGALPLTGISVNPGDTFLRITPGINLTAVMRGSDVIIDGVAGRFIVDTGTDGAAGYTDLTLRIPYPLTSQPIANATGTISLGVAAFTVAAANLNTSMQYHDALMNFYNAHLVSENEEVTAPLLGGGSVQRKTLKHFETQHNDVLDNALLQLGSLKGTRETQFRSDQKRNIDLTVRDGVISPSDAAPGANVIYRDLYTTATDPNTLWLGHSKAHEALINGIRFDIKNINNSGTPANKFNLPQAASATPYLANTADSNGHLKFEHFVKGNNIYQAKTDITAGTAFSDINSFLPVSAVRQRYILLPLYREVTLGSEAGEYDYVAPGGLPQQSVEIYEGQSLSLVNTPLYEGDTYQGRMAQWSTLSEEDRDKWLTFENKIFVETVTRKYKQAQLIYRFIPVLGLGFDRIDAIEQVATLIDAVRGTYSVVADDGLGDFVTCINEAVIYTTLNDGAYHEILHNKFGTSRVYNVGSGAQSFWYSGSAKQATNLSDLFRFGSNADDNNAFTHQNHSKMAVNASGRPDGAFSDLPPTSCFEDCRASVFENTQSVNAVHHDCYSNQIRGTQGALMLHRFSDNTVKVNGGAGFTHANNQAIHFAVTEATTGAGAQNIEFDIETVTHWIIVGDNGNSMIIPVLQKTVHYCNWPFNNDVAYIYGAGNVAAEFNAKFQIGTILTLGAISESDIPVCGEYMDSGYIGTPSKINAQMDAFGVDSFPGTWIGMPAADGSSKTFSPIVKTTSMLTGPFTDDDGATWINGSINFSGTTTNSYSSDIPANRFLIVNYTIFANAFESTARNVVDNRELSVCIATNYHDKDYGSVFASHTVSVIPANSVGPFAQTVGELTHWVIDNDLLYNGTLLTLPDYTPRHAPLELSGTSDGFKSAAYKHTDGELKTYAYCVVKSVSGTYSSTDNEKLEIVDGQSKMESESPGMYVTVGHYKTKNQLPGF